MTIEIPLSEAGELIAELVKQGLTFRATVYGGQMKIELTGGY